MDPQTTSAMNILAEMYEENSQLDDAIRCRKQMLAILKDSATFGCRESIVEICLLADLYWTQGYDHEVLELMQTELEDLKKVEEDDYKEVLEDLIVFVMQRLEEKMNGDQDAEGIGWTDMMQEWSNVS